MKAKIAARIWLSQGIVIFNRLAELKEGQIVKEGSFLVQIYPRRVGNDCLVEIARPALDDPSAPLTVESKRAILLWDEEELAPNVRRIHTGSATTALSCKSRRDGLNVARIALARATSSAGPRTIIRNLSVLSAVS